MEYFILIASIILWLLPSMLALNTKHFAAIFILDILIGWFPIAWLVLLIWSILAPK